MPIGPKLTALDGVLPDDEIHVWHTDLGLSQEAIVELGVVLDPGERARAARFLVEGARRQYVISHAFLRTVLAKYLNDAPEALRFSTSGNDKPKLASDTGIDFNLSHTEGTAAIVIARNRRVGVDVEKIGRNLKPLELATRFFSPQEYEWLRAQPASEQLTAFFSCWTAKECYIKAVGEGLSMGLSGFAIIPKTGNARLRLEVYGEPEESKKWLVWQLELKTGTCAAVAAESNEMTVRIGEWFPFR